MFDEIILFIFDEVLLKILYIMMFCLILYLVYSIAYEIYLKIIDYKTSIHIETGVVIDKYEEETETPINIGNTIIFNSYIDLY